MTNKKNKSLIFGISGQDGAYLAKQLIEAGNEVFGTSRDIETANFSKLRELGIFSDIKLYSVSLTDFRSVMQVIMKVKPDEIYNLAGQSSVALSFELPFETLESISTGTLNILESIRLIDTGIRFYNACSSECFGNTEGAADEETPFRPRSPYAVAKASSFWQVANYREAYNIFACSGILFNHESPLRPHRFVTKKIISTACKIAKGSNEKLILGDLSIKRDWGWAPEYTQAMHLMLLNDKPEDFVISTGEVNSLETFVKTVFSILKLEFEKYVISEPLLYRPVDIQISYGNSAKAKEILKWQANYKMKNVIEKMLEVEKNAL